MAGFPSQISEKVRRRLAALGVTGDEVEEHFVRGTGPGGQKINKTSSTVTLRHRPTGLEVRCQNERSQAANREQAWEELCRRLESRRASAVLATQNQRESQRRRTRQKSRGQKARMIEAKQRRAIVKSWRARPAAD